MKSIGWKKMWCWLSVPLNIFYSYTGSCLIFSLDGGLSIITKLLPYLLLWMSITYIHCWVCGFMVCVMNITCHIDVKKSTRLINGKRDVILEFSNVVCRWQHTGLSSFASNTNGQQSFVGCVKLSGIIYLILTNTETKGTDLTCLHLRACSCILIQDLNS